ncbi:hypothetical protein [Bacillus mojavensis]
MKKEILFHTIEYWYEMHPNMALPESEEEHIKQMINEGYREGELNYNDNETEKQYYGWWKIVSE